MSSENIKKLIKNQDTMDKSEIVSSLFKIVDDLVDLELNYISTSDDKVNIIIFVNSIDSIYKNIMSVSKTEDKSKIKECITVINEYCNKIFAILKIF